jgi:protein-disulfide isomerase
MAKQQTPPNNDSFKEQRDILKEINAELGKRLTITKEASNEYSKLENIARQLQDDEEGITQLNEKQLKKLKERTEASLRDLTSAASRLKITKNSTQEEKALNNAKKDQFKIEKELLENVKARLEKEQQIQKSLGITGSVLKGISKIPILGDLVNTEDALIKAREAAENGAGKFGAMGAAFKSLGGSLAGSLSDPLVSIGLLVKGFKMFLDLGFKADTEITNLSKSMASSKEEASSVRDRFIEIQNSGENLLETTKNLVAAQLDLADAFGVTRGFSEQQIRDQVLLTQNMGLQADEAAGIQQLAMSNGMTAREVTGSVIKQTAALAKQTGVQLDNKKIIGEVAKISGQLRLQYANNPKLIAAAVVQTKKLGLSLEQASKAANSLLDFESSIESELSAELLTGKSLNLERARGLALNGDAAGAAAEMAKQVGSAADFTNMNVIQQEALAKAVGMSADELANSLITQENLAKLGGETKKQLEEKAEALRAEGKIDEANRLLSSAGDEEQAQAALERISAQDKFNAAMEKLKSMIASIVEGPASSFVDALGAVLGDANALKNIFYSISTILGAISLTKLIMGLVSALATSGALAATTAATASALTLGIGAIAVVAGLVSIMSAVNSAKSNAKKVNDGVINPQGGLVVSGPEGSINLNKKDSIIAGTNLGGNSKNNGDGGSSSEIRELKNMMAAIANRPINISIDGKKVIEATTGAQPNTTGDETRKNSYRIS